MTHTRKWTVDVFLYESDAEVTAEAVLHADVPSRSPDAAPHVWVPPAVPEIGAELATSRALSALGHRLLELTAQDLAALPRRPVAN